MAGSLTCMKRARERLRQLLLRQLTVYRTARAVYRGCRIPIERWRLRKALAAESSWRIVVGSAGHYDEGWIPTEISSLNLLKPRNWGWFFVPGSIDAILAEHVWEHLSIEEGRLAARVCYRYLKQGGYLRIAVPDGLHPDPCYLESVRVGGSGVAAEDHKVLYNYRTLSETVRSAGFSVKLYEYFDEDGHFHHEYWAPEDGKIYRSCRFDKSNAGGQLKYTSIILDAVKEPPALCVYPGAEQVRIDADRLPRADGATGECLRR